eukprot:2967917-Rhodomonas_salina.1
MNSLQPAAVRAADALASWSILRQSAAPGQTKITRSPGSPHSSFPFRLPTILASNATAVVHRAFALSRTDVSKSVTFWPVRVARE